MTRQHLRCLLVGAPVASLVWGLVAWLRHGIDMPWYDDWRDLADGSVRSLAPAHLFRAINYTLSPTGIALDALAQRLLDGNAIGYQLLSMLGVLGGLLVLQWRLLQVALGEPRVAAACFLGTLFMLQPGSYWGLENLAYHQALPLLFILAAWRIVLRPPERRGRWQGPVLALLALLAGLSYISGAFGGLAAGAVLLVLAWPGRRDPSGRALLRDAAWFTSGAAVATAAQFVFSFLTHHGTAQAVPLALPHQAAFWWYALGKVGRSLLLPAGWPLVSMAASVAAVAATVAACAWLARRLVPGAADPAERRVALVLLPLAALAAVYLGMVTAGRAGLRPADVQGAQQVFQHGFVRFHFFWLTLLWPWLAAAGWLAWRGRIRLPSWAPVAAAVGFVAAIAALGGFAHARYQQARAGERAAVLQCLQQELQKEGPIRCPGLLPPRRSESTPDAWPAYQHAQSIGASFVRGVPVQPGSERLAQRTALFDLQAQVGTLETQQMRRAAGSAFEVTGDDPQLFLNFASRDAARCAVLDLVAVLQVPRPGMAALYWGDTTFTGPFSDKAVQQRAVRGGPEETVAFRIASPAGFFPSLRFDPVQGRAPLRIASLRAYCVSERAAAPAMR